MSKNKGANVKTVKIQQTRETAAVSLTKHASATPVTKSAARVLSATRILQSPAAVVRPGMKAAVRKVVARECAEEMS